MNHEDLSDRQWVDRVQAGEVDAFEPLVLRHEKRVFNLLFRWLGDYDEAAEAAQEVFLSAFRSIGTFRGEALFSTWLFQIAVNCARNRRKRLAVDRGRMVPFEPGDPEGDGGPAARVPHPGRGPEAQAEQKELSEAVQRGLNQLDPDDALVILLHDYEEMAYEEMASALKIPLGTVKSRLHRARLALKKRLESFLEKSRAPK